MIIIASYSNVSVTYTADGTQTVFSFPFDYLRKAFVFVEVNGETVLEQGTDYSVVDKTVVFQTAPVADTVLRIYRQTDTRPLVSWADASVLRAKDMTIQQIQELHILEEDRYWIETNTITRDNDGWDALGQPIKNVGDPEDPEDAATKEYVDDTYEDVKGKLDDLDEAVGEATEAAQAAEQALEDTREFAVEPVYYYFNPHNVALENPGATAHMNECHIIKINDKIIMIDTGGWGWTEATQNYLQAIGVTHVDYLIISHYHGDHAGGLRYMDYIDWTGCIAYLPPIPTYAEVIAESSNIGAYRQQCVDFLSTHNVRQIIEPVENDTLIVDDVLKFTLFNCDATAWANIYARQQARLALDSTAYDYYYNDYSLVSLVEHKNTKIVYSGDIMQVAQERMLENQFYQNVDVYKMHHHGLNYYGSAAYANSLNPKIVTVQVTNSWADSYLNEKLINTDTQYFLDKTILYPFNHIAKLMSDGRSIVIVEGKETYTKKDKNILSLSSNVTRILNNSDLNDYTQGTYSLSSGSVVSSCANAPTDWSYGNARLIAFRNAGGTLPNEGYITQFLISSNSNGVIYMRTCDGGVWKSWKRIVFDGAENTSISLSPYGRIYFYDNSLRVVGNNSTSDGASLILNVASNGGGFRGAASDGTNTSMLTLYPDGTLFLDNFKISPYKPGDTETVTIWGGGGNLTGGNKMVGVTIPLNKQISSAVTSATLTAGTITIRQNNSYLGDNISIVNSTAEITPCGLYLRLYKDAQQSSWGGTNNAPVGVEIRNLQISFS